MDRVGKSTWTAAAGRRSGGRMVGWGWGWLMRWRKEGGWKEGRGTSDDEDICLCSAPGRI